MATYTTIPTFTAGQVLRANGDGSTYAGMNDLKNNLDLLNAQSAYPYRNLLYNGAMQVSQRGTSVASITSSLVCQTADRWASSLNLLGTWTQSVENDAPANSVLRRSLKMLCTTANASPGATAYHLLEQRLEGYDVQRIAKGTTAAQQLTLSFWVKSNVTGTYVVELNDNDNTRLASKTYTVSASGTWEQKSVTFPADTTGQFDNDANLSLTVGWWLGSGSDYSSGTLNTSTWAARTNTNRAVGSTNVGSAINNYWQITGVQLEVGAVSTPIEVLPYGDDLKRCQRYFIALRNPFLMGQARGTASAYFPFTYPTEMRAAATPSQVGSINVIRYSDTGYASTAFTYFSATRHSVRIQHDIGSASLTLGDAVFTQYGSANAENDGYNFSAEL